MSNFQDDRDKPTIFFDEEIMPQMLLIIKKAREYVIFVTPYLDLWEHLTDKIEKTLAKGVDVYFVIRTEEVSKKKKL